MLAAFPQIHVFAASWDSSELGAISLVTVPRFGKEACLSPSCRLTQPSSLQEDLSMPMIEEEIDGLSGLLFPFYDADTHMLYLAGKVLG